MFGETMNNECYGGVVALRAPPTVNTLSRSDGKGRWLCLIDTHNSRRDVNKILISCVNHYSFDNKIMRITHDTSMKQYDTSKIKPTLEITGAK